MSRTMIPGSDVPEHQRTPIDEYVMMPGIRGTMKIQKKSGSMHGGGARIYLEGHDISHLVTKYTIHSATDDATRVELHLTRVQVNIESV